MHYTNIITKIRKKIFGIIPKTPSIGSKALTLFNGSQISTGTKVKLKVVTEDLIKNIKTIQNILHILSLFKIVKSFNKYEFI